MFSTENMGLEGGFLHNLTIIYFMFRNCVLACLLDIRVENDIFNKSVALMLTKSNLIYAKLIQCSTYKLSKILNLLQISYTVTPPLKSS